MRIRKKLVGRVTRCSRGKMGKGHVRGKSASVWSTGVESRWIAMQYHAMEKEEVGWMDGWATSEVR